MPGKEIAESYQITRLAIINFFFLQFQLQLYYYMQKVASAGMGNPKERKECPICGKTLYDRSTWNRHMRIHTGKSHFYNLLRYAHTFFY